MIWTKILIISLISFIHFLPGSSVPNEMSNACEGNSNILKECKVKYDIEGDLFESLGKNASIYCSKLTKKNKDLKSCLEAKVITCPSAMRNMLTLPASVELDSCEGIATCPNAEAYLTKAVACMVHESKMQPSFTTEENCKALNETISCLDDALNPCPKIKKIFRISLMGKKQLCPTYNGIFFSEDNPMYGCDSLFGANGNPFGELANLSNPQSLSPSTICKSIQKMIQVFDTTLGKCSVFKETKDFMISEMKKQTEVLCGSKDNGKCQLAKVMECQKYMPQPNMNQTDNPLDISNLLNYKELCSKLTTVEVQVTNCIDDAVQNCTNPVEKENHKSMILSSFTFCKSLSDCKQDSIYQDLTKCTSKAFKDMLNFQGDKTKLCSTQDNLFKCVLASAKPCPNLEAYFRNQLLTVKIALKKICPKLSLTPQAKTCTDYSKSLALEGIKNCKLQMISKMGNFMEVSDNSGRCRAYTEIFDCVDKMTGPCRDVFTEFYSSMKNDKFFISCQLKIASNGDLPCENYFEKLQDAQTCETPLKDIMMKNSENLVGNKNFDVFCSNYKKMSDCQDTFVKGCDLERKTITTDSLIKRYSDNLSKTCKLSDSSSTISVAVPSIVTLCLIALMQVVIGELP